MEIVTVWLSGGPHDGDSHDMSRPLPPTITTADGTLYENTGPEVDGAGKPLTTWQYRWVPQAY